MIRNQANPAVISKITKLGLSQIEKFYEKNIFEISNISESYNEQICKSNYYIYI